jgi:hypothetical protein
MDIRTNETPQTLHNKALSHIHRYSNREHKIYGLKNNMLTVRQTSQICEGNIKYYNFNIWFEFKVLETFEGTILKNQICAKLCYDEVKTFYLR